VILLRAAGIPARISFGYAQGEPIEGTSSYSVRELDAHAWPEVYFPTLGWVEFEPTVTQPDLLRPPGEEPGDESPTNPENLENQAPLIPPALDPQGPTSSGIPAGQNLAGIVLLITAGLVLVLALLLIPLIRRKKLLERIPSVAIVLDKGFKRVGIRPPAIIGRWAHRASLSPIARSYLEINLALARLGQRPAPSDTPRERTEHLKVEIPFADKDADCILHEYQLSTYSLAYKPDISATIQAGKTIRRLSFRALFQRLLSRN
jgi:hypothetical protein